jgi:hypothetical protein
MSAGFAFLTALSAMLGYLLNAPGLYMWHGGAGMALPSAICIAANSVNIILLTFLNGKVKQ